jgi:phosphoribosylglycinamide formyltransferase-1
VVLVSGRGSNLHAIVHRQRAMRVVAVVSNRPAAGAIEIARAAGIATDVVDHRAFSERADFDAALAACIDRHAPDYVVLAGFMRILGEGFTRRYPRRIVNIHPSLLPAYPGLDTHARAIADGVKLAGATVHMVTPRLDHGPILIQGAVPVLADDDAARLAARVLEVEHRIYPQALTWLAEDRVEWLSGDVLRVRGQDVADHSLVSPMLEP